MDQAAESRVASQASSLIPSGTVTFLFTDIEGSTERWEHFRAAMTAALGRHDAVLQAAIADNGGHVFKKMGDAYCAAFRTAPEAVRAAIAAQLALLKEDFSAVNGLQVRMALHTGYADERDRDYFGPSVNRAARLLSIGHGGQMLVSAATSDLVQGELPAQVSLRALGAHRLKDLAHPEQVFQLVAAGLPADFPPLRSLDSLPNNLPLQVTSFVGRDEDVSEVKQLLGKTRLLTLTGSGGVGKTRLALQVGAELLEEHPDGVWLVDLAGLQDSDLVVSQVASVLGVRVGADRSLADSIIYALKPKRALIIVDNCEHLITAAAHVTGAIIKGAPNVRVMTTSREGLGIAGETIYRVNSLAVPKSSAEVTAANATQFGAVALFVDRATAANTRFTLNDKNAAVVARICEQLDGIPLAIEMAAARTKVLSVEQLAARLEDRFRILTASNRSALPRQQTMRALIDWSYDLLSDNEKTVFRRLSVFAGGCALDAASSVCSDAAIDPLDVLDLLTGLVDKSLIVTELAGSEQRYRLLASTRQYATELLEKSGEADVVRARHAAFFLEFADKAEAEWSTTPSRVWTERLLPDIDNFRAALDWAVTGRHDVELGALLAATLCRFWVGGPQPDEGRRRLIAATSALSGQIAPELEARLRLARGHLEVRSWTYAPALEAGARALELYTQLGDKRGAAWARSVMGEAYLRLRRHEEAQAALDAALETFQALGDSRMIGTVLTQQGRNLHFQRRHEEGLALYNRGLTYAQATGDTGLIDAISNNIAEVEFRQGNVEKALDLAQAILPHYPAWERMSLALTRANIAAYLIYLGRFDEAREVARAAIKDARPAGPVTFAESVQHFAAIAAGQQQWEQSC